MLDAADEHSTLDSPFAAMGRSEEKSGASVVPDVEAVLHMIFDSPFAAMGRSEEKSESSVVPDVEAVLHMILDSTFAAMGRKTGSSGSTPHASVRFLNPKMLQLAI